MTSTKEFRLPNLGDGDGGGRVVEWLVGAGAAFEKGEVLVEVETDKATVEVEATEPGRLVEIVAEANVQVVRDQVLARIEVSGSQAAEGPGPSVDTDGSKPVRPSIVDDDGEGLTAATFARDSANPSGGARRVVATPAARRKIAEAGLSIHALTGTGKRGRINLSDVDRALAKRAGHVPSEAPARPGDRIQESDFEVQTRLGRIAFRRWSPNAKTAQGRVAFVHGLFAETGVWSGTARILARRGQEVLALDLPNHGRSACGATAFPEVVDAVSEALEQVMEGPTVLCGHSYGGAVAARIVGKIRRDLAALVFIAPLGLGTEIQQSFLNGILYSDSVAALAREMDRLTAHGIPTLGEEYIRNLLNHIRGNRETLAAMCREVAYNHVQQIDLRKDLADCPVPSRIIWGCRDEVLPWQHALSAPATTGLHLVPDAGHMPIWEAGSLATAVLLEVCVHTQPGLGPNR